VDLKRLGAILALAYEREFADFASLLLLENLGPRTLQSLALIAEVVHGAPSRFTDPARFSFAHGGKDGHPFPVPLKTYDESIGVLRRSLDAAKLGDRDKLEGFGRLEKFARAIEKRCAPEADFQRTIAHELSHVVQQSQGPVDGSDAPGGIKVSDPSDRFEQAADHQAETVMSSANLGSAPAPAASSSGGSVQREEDAAVPMPALQREEAPDEDEMPSGG